MPYLSNWVNHEGLVDEPVADVDTEFASGQKFIKLLVKVGEMDEQEAKQVEGEHVLLVYEKICKTMDRIGCQYKKALVGKAMEGKRGAASSLLMALKKGLESRRGRGQQGKAGERGGPAVRDGQHARSARQKPFVRQDLDDYGKDDFFQRTYDSFDPSDWGKIDMAVHLRRFHDTQRAIERQVLESEGEARREVSDARQAKREYFKQRRRERTTFLRERMDACEEAWRESYKVSEERERSDLRYELTFQKRKDTQAAIDRYLLSEEVDREIDSFEKNLKRLGVGMDGGAVPGKSMSTLSESGVQYLERIEKESEGAGMTTEAKQEMMQALKTKAHSSQQARHERQRRRRKMLVDQRAAQIQHEEEERRETELHRLEEEGEELRKQAQNRWEKEVKKSYERRERDERTRILSETYTGALDGVFDELTVTARAEHEARGGEREAAAHALAEAKAARGKEKHRRAVALCEEVAEGIVALAATTAAMRAAKARPLVLSEWQALKRSFVKDTIRPPAPPPLPKLRGGRELVLEAEFSAAVELLGPWAVPPCFHAPGPTKPEVEGEGQEGEASAPDAPIDGKAEQALAQEGQAGAQAEQASVQEGQEMKTGLALFPSTLDHFTSSLATLEAAMEAAGADASASPSGLTLSTSSPLTTPLRVALGHTDGKAHAAAKEAAERLGLVFTTPEDALAHAVERAQGVEGEVDELDEGEKEVVAVGNAQLRRQAAELEGGAEGGEEQQLEMAEETLAALAAKAVYLHLGNLKGKIGPRWPVFIRTEQEEDEAEGRNEWDGVCGWLVGGFPRTPLEARLLEHLLSGGTDADLDAMLEAATADPTTSAKGKGKGKGGKKSGKGGGSGGATGESEPPPEGKRMTYDPPKPRAQLDLVMVPTGEGQVPGVDEVFTAYGGCAVVEVGEVRAGQGGRELLEMVLEATADREERYKAAATLVLEHRKEQQQREDAGEDAGEDGGEAGEAEQPVASEAPPMPEPELEVDPSAASVLAKRRETKRRELPLAGRMWMAFASGELDVDYPALRRVVQDFERSKQAATTRLQQACLSLLALDDNAIAFASNASWATAKALRSVEGDPAAHEMAVHRDALAKFLSEFPNAVGTGTKAERERRVSMAEDLSFELGSLIDHRHERAMEGAMLVYQQADGWAGNSTRSASKAAMEAAAALSQELEAGLCALNAFWDERLPGIAPHPPSGRLAELEECMVAMHALLREDIERAGLVEGLGAPVTPDFEVNAFFSQLCDEVGTVDVEMPVSERLEGEAEQQLHREAVLTLRLHTAERLRGLCRRCSKVRELAVHAAGRVKGQVEWLVRQRTRAEYSAVAGFGKVAKEAAVESGEALLRVMDMQPPLEQMKGDALIVGDPALPVDLGGASLTLRQLSQIITSLAEAAAGRDLLPWETIADAFLALEDGSMDALPPIWRVSKVYERIGSLLLSHQGHGDGGRKEEGVVPWRRLAFLLTISLIKQMPTDEEVISLAGSLRRRSSRHPKFGFILHRSEFVETGFWMDENVDTFTSQAVKGFLAIIFDTMDPTAGSPMVSVEQLLGSLCMARARPTPSGYSQGVFRLCLAASSLLGTDSAFAAAPKTQSLSPPVVDLVWAMGRPHLTADSDGGNNSELAEAPESEPRRAELPFLEVSRRAQRQGWVRWMWVPQVAAFLARCEADHARGSGSGGGSRTSSTQAD